MHRIYFNGISSISPQAEEIFLNAGPKIYEQRILPALEQDYKAIIKPMMLRRMSSAVKMGLFCAKNALEQAGISLPEAILVGTGQGCMQDTEKFMVDMLDANEGLLSPTSFIQSTHNTVGGQIALYLKCKAHNITYSQNSVSFESALMDAMLQMQHSAVENSLVGGVDEIAGKFTDFQKLDGQIKREPVRTTELFSSGSPGSVISEAAAFFALSTNRQPGSFAELGDVQINYSLDADELENAVSDFLQRNALDVSKLDAVILGNNGDSRFDHYYEKLQGGIFSEICQLGFKHLVGENNTISSYACWLACKILKYNKIPDVFKINSLSSESPRNILVYNQYLGKNHGLILLKSCEV